MIRYDCFAAAREIWPRSLFLMPDNEHQISDNHHYFRQIYAGIIIFLDEASLRSLRNVLTVFAGATELGLIVTFFLPLKKHYGSRFWFLKMGRRSSRTQNFARQISHINEIIKSIFFQASFKEHHWFFLINQTIAIEIEIFKTRKYMIYIP